MPGKNREKEVEQEQKESGNTSRRGTYSGQTSQGGGRGGTSARDAEEGAPGGTNKDRKE